MVTKSTLVEQLDTLVQKFKNLASNGNCDHEEASIKLIDTVTNSKHISVLKDIDEIVSSKRVLIFYIVLFLLKFKIKLLSFSDQKYSEQ